MSFLAIVVVLCLLFLVGSPIAAALGIAGVIGLLITGQPLRIVGEVLYSAIDNFVLLAIPLFIFMRNLHLVNSYWSLIITYLTFGLPLSIWLLKGFYDNIPYQLEQAARIDGASRFQAFVRVVMPPSLDHPAVAS